MTVAFYTVLRRDPQHFLHAVGLVDSIRRTMPGVTILQLTDDVTPLVDGVDHIRRLPHGPMLERRLEHYATCVGDCLFVDTDVELRSDVSSIFPPTPFDIAIADRHWPGIPQDEETMHTMPFNTGVVFSRNPLFWQEALSVWRSYPTEQRDWMSEQRAVYTVIRTGRFLVQILPGQVYNYPPRTKEDPCTGAALVHYKGPRKAWLTERIVSGWRVQEPACVSV